MKNTTQTLNKKDGVSNFCKTGLPILIIIIAIIVCIILITQLNKTSTKSHKDTFTIKQRPGPKIPYELYKTGPYSYETLPHSIQTVMDISAKHFAAKIRYYDDVECRRLIEQNFEPNVLKAYDMLIPSAFKADLWRYCVLYLYGGIYSDIGHRLLEDFQINPDGEEGPDMILVKDRPIVESKSSITDAAIPSSGGANNSIQISFIATIPKNNFLKYVIDNVVKDILARRYNRGVLDITGPAAFGRIFSHFFQYENDMDTSFVEPKKLTGLDGKTYKISIPLRQSHTWGEDGDQLEDIKTNKVIVKTKINNYRQLVYKNKRPHYNELYQKHLVYK